MFFLLLFLGGGSGLKYNNMTIENMAFWSIIVLECIYTYHILYVYSVWLSITPSKYKYHKTSTVPKCIFFIAYIEFSQSGDLQACRWIAISPPFATLGIDCTTIQRMLGEKSETGKSQRTLAAENRIYNFFLNVKICWQVWANNRSSQGKVKQLFR